MIINNVQNNFDVMVYVMTYNHEKYIKQCLNSIFMQKATFRYLVCICDDFSTDSNRKIIKEYYDKNIDKCILIFEDEDKMQKGCYNFHLKNIQNLPKVKYIAFAEGDDYFTDENKLQKQYEILEKYQNLTCCYHGTDLYDEQKKSSFAIIPNKNLVGTSDGILNKEKLIVHNCQYGNIFSYNIF